ncbi:efflux transporter outer membrane subunit [Pseudomonas viridiflava]|uniref:efflux transporter outer membrane subunit n=1 Tax=Pseudomonas viridiflava TaxID=33069 RepID=UPI002E9E1688|nr:efflux transporter outer membrane subunit [Pseudomonas viridiflava]MEE3932608.1 efflux transporter outer membrane subunit [Pseudomonas viridiflava]MEE3943481.1 efflux transporter outer membrane subunit [Pseudomonas viridiflava]MEE3969054.1 efflux transporter outer membrane subunit [Pseudomonas viridiflava]MEE3983497.1 efflux transporter outer membrane subunit [Pseudomonas viridiflava]
MSRIAAASSLVLLASLSGCQVGQDFQRPQTSDVQWLPIQGEQAASQVNTTPYSARWREIFRDPQLSSLIDRAAASNLDLKMAEARLAQSRAARQVIVGEQVPSVDGKLGYQRKRNSAEGLNDPSGNEGRAAFSQWDGGINASWEVDLWGRVKREVEAADANVDVADNDQRAALLSLQAEVARDYLQLRGTQSVLAVTRQNLQLSRNSLELSKVRQGSGVATNLDVAEAAVQVSAVESRLPVLEQRQARLINALSLLLAQSPRALQSELEKPVEMVAVPATVPVGLPSELAQRRPDIRRAEARLHAATASIGVAQGDFYPRIVLSGNVGFQALQLSDLGSWGSRQFGIGPQLSLPIFEGGRLRGMLRLREAQEQETALAYQQTVLRAWQEIDDSMSLYNASQLQQRKLDEAVRQNRIALDTAKRQYTEGVVDFLNVLTVQRTLLDIEEQWVQSSTTQAQALVGLYSALGGGW